MMKTQKISFNYTYQDLYTELGILAIDLLYQMQHYSITHNKMMLIMI